MWRCTCFSRNAYDFRYAFKPLFRCAQACHLVIFCWLLVAIIGDSGAGTLKGPALSTSSLLDELPERQPMTVILVSGTWRQFCCATA